MLIAPEKSLLEFIDVWLNEHGQKDRKLVDADEVTDKLLDLRSIVTKLNLN
jgi:hypothetical protein